MFKVFEERGTVMSFCWCKRIVLKAGGGGVVANVSSLPSRVYIRSFGGKVVRVAQFCDTVSEHSSSEDLK